MNNIEDIKDKIKDLKLENITEEDINIIYQYISLFLDEMSLDDIEFWENILSLIDNDYES